jgi:copper(I)-binding protein
MKQLLVIVPALAALTSAFPSAAASLEVRDAWIREAPPTASVLAAYMVIRNPGTVPVEITNVSGPEFGRAEMHRTVVEGGVATMVAIRKLEIAPGEQIALEPGGTHLMLIDPRRPLRAGDTATLTFQDAGGRTSTFSVPVTRETGESDRHH